MNCIDCANTNCESASVCDMDVNNCEAYVPNSNLAVLKEMCIEDFASFLAQMADCPCHCEAWCEECVMGKLSCKDAWIAWLKKPPVLATKD